MYNYKFKISKNQQEELFIKLAKCLVELKNPVEAAQFIKDLLSETEVLMLARRLQIAELLLDGLKYDEIKERLKVGPGTIAKVQTWLNLYGEGYRTVISRLSRKGGKDVMHEQTTQSFNRLKKQYPMYYWPEILLQEIVKSTTKKKKQQLLNIARGMKEKTVLSKEIEKLIKL